MRHGISAASRPSTSKYMLGLQKSLANSAIVDPAGGSAAQHIEARAPITAADVSLNRLNETIIHDNTTLCQDNEWKACACLRPTGRKLAHRGSKVVADLGLTRASTI